MARVTTIDPEAESASAGGRAVDPEYALAEPEQARRLPFAARVQAVLVVVMIGGFVLIAQPWSKTVFQLGLPLLVLAAFLQIAFGNIPPTAGLKRSLPLLGLTWVIVAIFFIVAINITPQLITLGR
jgi:hypothetical protein